MLIDFNSLKELTIANLDGGDGEVSAKMYINNTGKIIVSRIPPKSSIGLHCQKTSNDINYVLRGHGKALCDEKEEVLLPGVCHYCPKGSYHSIINTGDEDLVLFSVIAEQ